MGVALRHHVCNFWSRSPNRPLEKKIGPKTLKTIIFMPITRGIRNFPIFREFSHGRAWA